ncbi:uncharacterized protein BT62DRAFT_1010235 [Guyanagaster necrorhizus]|uniref:IRG-type G domain-containing protein n=1 Tax=Guyanagaster necrorhizus TaxID=856835 RepID=A0A9P8AP59_9AGAR|nr:uncharacterized protein BT62DRAFT_1010235 [Guyanagaster necrorhizus MCA 3950]KAG7442624.1 hypothetical protein BT62DRAFT_1010235 [Guyanagaster necrorhizus MCA 3950]
MTAGRLCCLWPAFESLGASPELLTPSQAGNKWRPVNTPSTSTAYKSPQSSGFRSKARPLVFSTLTLISVVVAFVLGLPQSHFLQLYTKPSGSLRMGAAGSVIPAVVAAAGAIPGILGAVRGSKVKENPTMATIEGQLKNAEAEKLKAQKQAEQFEREVQAQKERIKNLQDATDRTSQLVEQLERERQAQAERSRVQQEEVERATQTAAQLQREKQEQAEIAQREREAAQRAAQAAKELQEQVRKKEEEMKKVLEVQKEMEAKWKKGIHPVEWPSREQYEANKQRFYKEGKFHLAIAGISGTGKSSLINAFRGIWDDEQGTAATDIVESTSVVTPYPDPNPANPFIWFDVPGSGTLACSDWTYFNDQGLYIFDAIIVLFNDRFTATDIAILKNCERYKIPTYIVRSKSDIHIENLIKKKRRGAGAKNDPAKILDEARKEYLSKTQESVRLNLMKNDPPIRSQKMYAVSRDTLTMVVREELVEDSLVLNEVELLRDILQDAYSRRSEKSYSSMADLMKKAGMDILRFFTN